MDEAGGRSAGWYDDPIRAGRRRYWDGQAWTDDVADAPPEPPPFVGRDGGEQAAFRGGAPEDALAGGAAVGDVEPAARAAWWRRRPVIALGGLAILLIVLGAVIAGGSGDPEDPAEVSASADEVEDEPTEAEIAAVRKDYETAVQRSCESLVERTSAESPNPSLDLLWAEKYAQVLDLSRNDMAREVRQCGKPASDEAKAEAKRAQQEREAAEAAERAAAEARAAEAAAAAAAAEQAAIDNAGAVDVDSVVKNPDAVKGQVFRLVAEIVQMDAATGPCMFRASWDRVAREYSFEYEGDNAMFSSQPTVAYGTDCPVFDGVDQDDVVHLVVRAQGSYSYDTQIGGSTTVPLFQVLRVDNVVKG